MATGRGRPRSADTDRALLDATIEVLREQGFGGLTIEAVAQRAGVGRPTLYRRWSNKQELVVAALRSAVAHADEPDTGDPVEDLRLQVGGLAERLREGDAGPLLLGVYAAAQHDSTLAAALREGYLGPGITWLNQTVARAVASGQLPADADPELVRNLLFGPLLYHLTIAGEPASAELSARMVDAALAGVRSSRRD